MRYSKDIKCEKLSEDAIKKIEEFVIRYVVKDNKSKYPKSKLCGDVRNYLSKDDIKLPRHKKGEFDLFNYMNTHYNLNIDNEGKHQKVWWEAKCVYKRN